MASLAYINGLSAVAPPFAVIHSDYDGGDCCDELMAEFDKMSDEPACQGRSVPAYSVRGTLGAITVDLIYFYMFGGVPFILDPGVIAVTDGERGAVMVNRSGQFISELFSRNNGEVFSIGYVDDPCEAYSYAVEFTRRTVPTKDTGIDADLVNSYIAANPDSMMHVGTIQNPGGTIFDVYAISSTESAMFRPDKDFMGGEPDVEDDKEGSGGRIEVILCGGNPDIVCIGSICSAEGWMFSVWVPNEKGFVDCGKHMLEQGDVPLDAICFDEDDLEQAYHMYEEKLRYDESEAEGEEDEETDVPDFDYEEFYSEEAERRSEPETV